jgi:DNA-binding response OmpR family regulator
MSKILVVEDDACISDGVRDWLVLEKYLVEQTANGGDALQLLLNYKYDLIILDLELPESSGLEVCRVYRSRGGTTPILMLTGKNTVRDKREGLDSGADDYLTKPFDLEELSARIRALLRRPAPIRTGPIQVGAVTLDPSKRIVTHNGEVLQLSPKEFSLLELLMKYPNTVFSQNDLFQQIWQSTSDTSPDMVRTVIKQLRRKLDATGESCLIQNVHGQGYKLVPP